MRDRSSLLGREAPVGVAAVVLMLLLAALASACQQGGSEEGTPGGIVVMVTSPTPPRSTPSATRTATPTPSPSRTPLQVCAPNPDPAPAKLLQVLEPHPEEEVGVPFAVRGWGSNIGFRDAGVAVALVNANQQVVQVLNDVPPQPRDYRVPPFGLEITDFTRPFAVDIVLSDLTGPTPYCLWVYLETTADGTPKGVVQLPILVTP